VAGIASATSQDAGTTQRAAGDLAGTAAELDELVSSFRYRAMVTLLLR
jgi:hypothetical protein